MLGIDAHLDPPRSGDPSYAIGDLLGCAARHACRIIGGVSDSSIVRLPVDIGEPFEVYLNGVPQQAGIDYETDGRILRFPRRLARDRVSGWRWLVGAFGIGTYRQDDSVDVRYERDGRSRVASLAIEPSGED
jgi:hypothetical protein